MQKRPFPAGSAGASRSMSEAMTQAAPAFAAAMPSMPQPAPKAKTAYLQPTQLDPEYSGQDLVRRPAKTPVRARNGQGGKVLFVCRPERTFRRNQP